MQGHLCTLHSKSALPVSIRPCHRLVLRLVNLRQSTKLQHWRSSRIISKAHDSADRESADKLVWVQTANMVRPQIPDQGNGSRAARFCKTRHHRCCRKYSLLQWNLASAHFCFLNSTSILLGSGRAWCSLRPYTAKVIPLPLTAHR